MTNQIPKTAMVIMAHPDDPEFFCGGTIALWTKHGAEITYVILTNGNKGSDDPEMTPERLAKTRRIEQENAAKILGVKRVLFFDENDGELFSTLEIREKVVREIRHYRPDALIAPDPTRYFFQNTYINHPDHRAAGEIVMGAIFPAAGNRMYHPELLYEGLEPHTVHHIYLAGSTEPTLWVDIGEVLDTKIEAIRCHATQIKEPDKLADRMRERSKAVDEYGREVYREGYRHLIIGL